MYQELFENYSKLSEDQKGFIDIVYIQCRKYADVVKEIKIDIVTIRQWYAELEPVWRPMSRIRNLYKTKGMTINFYSFFKWISEQERKCYYCGITKPQIQTLKELGLRNKRELTRGSALELDRKDSHALYDDLDNLTYCCYWCNNAKTDTFTADEFKEVGEAIGRVWRKRLGNLQ